MISRMEQLFLSPGFRFGASLVREFEAQQARGEGRLADAAAEAARAQELRTCSADRALQLFRTWADWRTSERAVGGDMGRPAVRQGRSPDGSQYWNWERHRATGQDGPYLPQNLQRLDSSQTRLTEGSFRTTNRLLVRDPEAAIPASDADLTI